VPVWKVDLQTIATITVEVEAEDAEKAAEIAQGQDICAQCSGWGRDWSMEIGEWSVADEGFPVRAMPFAQVVRLKKP
jgi:hypothetical protein